MPAPITDLLDAYAQYQRDRRRRRPRGVAEYLACLRAAVATLEPDAPITAITEAWVDAYLTAIGNRLATNSVLKILSALRSFCGWAVRTGQLSADPTRRVEAPKKYRPAPHPLTRAQLRALWRVLAPQDDDLPAVADDWARYRRAVHLMLFAGLRLSEVTALRWRDVEIEAGSLMVRDGKGGKTRAVPLHPALVAALRAAPGQDPAGAVVPSRHGTPYTDPQSLAHLFERSIPNRATAMGLSLRFSAHQLRHTFATEMLRGGADLRNIQELLGHAQLETTSGYLAVAPETLRAAVDVLPAGW